MNIKLIILTFIILINIFSIDALKLSLSPANITLDSVINEEICKEISISSDKIITLNVEDKWKINGKSSLIKDYTLNSKDLEIKISYPKEIAIQDRKSIDLCITPEKSGNYNGVLLFTSQNNLAGIGILINLNVLEAKEYNSSPYSNEITGKVIEDNLNEEETDYNMQFFLIMNAVFLTVLFFIILKIKN